MPASSLEGAASAWPGCFTVAMPEKLHDVWLETCLGQKVLSNGFGSEAKERAACRKKCDKEHNADDPHMSALKEV